MILSRLSRFPIYSLCGLTLIALLAFALPGTRSWSEDSAESTATSEVVAPPGEIRFVGKNKVAKAKSVFHQWKITKAEIDPANIGEGVVEIEIDIASLDTGIGKRDEHLRHGDFFDIETYPTATVRFHDASPLEGQPESGQWYTTKMDLTIRGITKTQDVKFQLLDPETFQVQGEFTILRTDFGVGEAYSKLNPLSIEDEVQLSFDATIHGDS